MILFQIINKLTQQELSKMLTDMVVIPRTYTLKPSRTMFITGLARIDYIEVKRDRIDKVLAK